MGWQGLEGGLWKESSWDSDQASAEELEAVKTQWARIIGHVPCARSYALCWGPKANLTWILSSSHWGFSLKEGRMCETTWGTFTIGGRVRLYSGYKNQPVLLNLKAEKKFSRGPFSVSYLPWNLQSSGNQKDFLKIELKLDDLCLSYLVWIFVWFTAEILVCLIVGSSPRGSRVRYIGSNIACALYYLSKTQTGLNSEIQQTPKVLDKGLWPVVKTFLPSLHFFTVRSPVIWLSGFVPQDPAKIAPPMYLFARFPSFWFVLLLLHLLAETCHSLLFWLFPWLHSTKGQYLDPLQPREQTSCVCLCLSLRQPSAPHRASL